MSGTIFGLDNIKNRKESYSLVTHDIVENADVCVIGSGAAGAIIAAKLAKSGRSVVLLEKGGYYDSEDMNQREIDMMSLLWKNGGANFTDDLRIIIAQGQCLGGSTVINDAVCFRTPQIVREQWRSIGVKISDQQWDDSINEVWSAINVSQVKPEELNDNNLMLKKACQLKGYKSGENNRNCKECMRCGFCHLGCHYETKQDMRVTYIRNALRDPTTDIRIYCNCAADKISYANGVADGVDGDFVDNMGSAKFKIRVNAKVIIISAGSIASSHLLLKNDIATGKAGKGLGLHPAPFLLGRFDQQINAYNGIPMAYACHEFGITNGISQGGFLIESIFLPILEFSLGLPSFLVEHERLMEDFTHYAMAGILVRDDTSGTITLSESGRPKVHYSLSQKDIVTISKSLKILAEMWFDVGAQHVVTGHEDVIRLESKEDIPKLVDAVMKNPNGLQLASAHPQGGNRMGEDSSVCVVDSNCKVHGFDNLFVCDASAFPTTLGVNPQITVMALGTMTANYINSVWDAKFAQNKTGTFLGQTCSIKQPMYCSAATLDTMFNESENQFPADILVNADDNTPQDQTWSFDKNTMMIYNNRYWKGFYPTDQDYTMMKYFGGFWKKFSKDGQSIKGITHPYESPVMANNIAQLQTYAGFGDIIYLKYTGLEYSLFYDLLKIVDKDTILGKAFIGIPPSGRQILTFSMSRRYSVEFMTRDDHETIYRQYATAPTPDQVVGTWEGKLVSDDALTPVSQVFTYSKGDSGLQMQYVFGGLLRGISRITLAPEQMNMYDYTNWHDEVRIVTEDFMVGKWCSPWTKIPLNFGPSFLSVEEGPDGRRFCIRFILKRV